MTDTLNEAWEAFKQARALRRAAITRVDRLRDDLSNAERELGRASDAFEEARKAFEKELDQVP